jgi:hypothetical protein
MLSLTYILLHFELGEVKGIAVSEKWVTDIKVAAKNVFGRVLDNQVPFDRGVEFDGKLVLMLVLPIRFANLKAADLASVSDYSSNRYVFFFFLTIDLLV